MTIKDVVSLFRKKYPDSEIRKLKRIKEWYIFTIGNTPKQKIGEFEFAIDPYIGYNTKTNKFSQVSPPMFGTREFFKAPELPFE